MPLTVYQVYFPVASTLLLLFCFTTSCTGDHYQECHWDTCGDFEFSYPFGKINSGCGDPQFQLHCVSESYPLLNISGDEYLILQPSYLANDTLNNNKMTIIDYNLWKAMPGGGKCNSSGNYSQFWWPASHFRIAHGYTNLTLWGHCNESIKRKSSHKRRLCGDDWYVISNPESGKRFCQSNLRVPVKNNFTIKKNEELSTRLLPGFEIAWHGDKKRDRSCGACLDSMGTCGYNISEPSSTFLCYANRIGHKNKSAIVIGCSTGGVALIAIAVLFSACYLKKRKPPSNFGKYERRDMETCVPGREIGDLPIFSYEALRQSTNCFHEENELGVGGFGSVYLGKLWDGRTVAVKRLSQDNSRRLDQFINEVKIFSTLNHPHIVRLYGCTSADSPELLLVYEFVPNGTLADHLHGDRKGPKGLPWNTRFNIAIQTAQALAFLHTVHPPILHRDVKSSNILLGENFIVKVADFGLCRLVPVDASHVTTAPQGTPGYVDPVYYQCYQLTEKSDVYSFGVVLVEIISARLAVDIHRKTWEINLASMAIAKIQQGVLHDLVDPELDIEKNHEVKVMVCAVAELAFRCLASDRDDRPQMEEVVAELEQIRHSCGTSTGPGEQQEGSLSDIKQLTTAPLSPTSVEGKRPSRSSILNNSV